jgi:phosphate uptake regulator
MKRKIMRMGSKTLVVSLPSEWAERQNLSKGESIEVIDKSQELVIRPLLEKHKRELAVDMRDYNDRLISRTLSAAYKTGFESMRIKCSKEQQKIIGKDINKYIGLVIIENNNDGLLIKNIIGCEAAEFQPLFKKTFLILNFIAKESLEARKGYDKAREEDILNNRENFLKHVNLCLSILNSSGFKSIKETNIYFYTISMLDTIGDLYFRIAGYSKKKLTLNEATFYERVNKLLEKTQKAFSEGIGINEAYSLKNEIFEDKKSKQDPKMTLLMVIAKLILEIIECRIMLNLLQTD